MPSVEEFGFTQFHRRETDITDLSLLDRQDTSDINYQIVDTEQTFPDISFSGEKIENLVVDKLLTGTISSQQISLGVVSGDGDVYIKAGTVDVSAWTATGGWILGLDDSDGDKEKFFIGNATSSADWNVTTADTFTIVGSITATTGVIGGFTLADGSMYGGNRRFGHDD